MSCSTSTKIPPRPTITSGPKRSLREIPAINSTPAAPAAATATPSKRAPGIRSASPRRMRSKASRTSTSLRRLSATPPTSLLWLTSGECTLSTTGKPIRAAASTASSALAANSGIAVAMPAAARTRLDSISESARAPGGDSLRDDLIDSLLRPRLWRIAKEFAI